MNNFDRLLNEKFDPAKRVKELLNQTGYDISNDENFIVTTSGNKLRISPVFEKPFEKSMIRMHGQKYLDDLSDTRAVELLKHLNVLFPGAFKKSSDSSVTGDLKKVQKSGEWEF